MKPPVGAKIIKDFKCMCDANDWGVKSNKVKHLRYITKEFNKYCCKRQATIGVCAIETIKSDLSSKSYGISKCSCYHLINLWKLILAARKRLLVALAAARAATCWSRKSKNYVGRKTLREWELYSGPISQVMKRFEAKHLNSSHCERWSRTEAANQISSAFLF